MVGILESVSLLVRWWFWRRCDPAAGLSLIRPADRSEVAAPRLPPGSPTKGRRQYATKLPNARKLPM
jgi:hypothetical protein